MKMDTGLGAGIKCSPSQGLHIYHILRKDLSLRKATGTALLSAFSYAIYMLLPCMIIYHNNFLSDFVREERD